MATERPFINHFHSRRHQRTHTNHFDRVNKYIVSRYDCYVFFSLKIHIFCRCVMIGDDALYDLFGLKTFLLLY